MGMKAEVNPNDLPVRVTWANGHGAERLSIADAVELRDSLNVTLAQLGSTAGSQLKPVAWMQPLDFSAIDRRRRSGESHANFGVRIDRQDDYYTVPLYAR